MKETRRFTLTPDAEARPDAVAKAHVLVDGHRTHLLVSGTVLEAAYQLEDLGLDLLFVTEDCPYEETLHIYLLDAAHTVIEETRLGAPYAPGILKDLLIVSDNELAFHFQGNHRLIIHAQPRGFLRHRRLELRAGAGVEQGRGAGS